MDQFIDEESSIYIALRSNNFDLGTFGNILPGVKNQSGKFSSKIDVNGPVNDLSTEGYFSLDDGLFTLRQNNLDYSISLRTNFNNKTAVVDNIILANAGGSRYTGEIRGKGELSLNKFPFSEFKLEFTGDLALLGRMSKTKNANIFGDLLVSVEDVLIFNYKDDLYSLSGDIVIERADLNYSVQRNINDLSNDRIIYQIIEDTSRISINNKKFVRILNETKNNSIELSDGDETSFLVNSKIILNNIASFNILISPELNQRLRIETTGQIEDHRK